MAAFRTRRCAHAHLNTQFRRAHEQRLAEREKEFLKQQELKKKGQGHKCDEELTRTKDYIVKFGFLEPLDPQPTAGISVQGVAFSYTGSPPWMFEKLDFGVNASTRMTLVGASSVLKSATSVFVFSRLCRLPRSGLERGRLRHRSEADSEAQGLAGFRRQRGLGKLPRQRGLGRLRSQRGLRRRWLSDACNVEGLATLLQGFRA